MITLEDLKTRLQEKIIQAKIINPADYLPVISENVQYGKNKYSELTPEAKIYVDKLLNLLLQFEE